MSKSMIFVIKTNISSITYLDKECHIFQNT